MTAPRLHHCRYVLFVNGRYMSVSMCCYGQTLHLPAPGCKPGRAA